MVENSKFRSIWLIIFSVLAVFFVFDIFISSSTSQLNTMISNSYKKQNFENPLNYYQKYDVSEIPSYSLSRSLTDDIYKNMVWVNSMIDNNATGFSNQDIILSIHLSELYTPENLKSVTLGDTYIIISDDDHYFYKLSSNSQGFEFWNFENPEIYNSFSTVEDGNFYLQSIYDPQGNLISDFSLAPNYFIYYQDLNLDSWSHFNKLLVDRDQQTGFSIHFKVDFNAKNPDEIIKLWLLNGLDYVFDLNVPEYAVFNSFLYMKNVPENLPTNFRWGDDIGLSNLAGSNERFYGSFQYTMKFFNSAQNEILNTYWFEPSTTVNVQGKNVLVPYSGNSKNNVFSAPDDLKVNSIDRISINWESTIADGNDDYWYIENGGSMFYDFGATEFNVFSDNPVYGYPEGDIDYPDCSFLNIFCHMRNWFTWIFFDSFIYDLMSPVLEPLYDLAGQMYVMVLTSFSTFGIIDPYLGTNDDFVVSAIEFSFLFIAVLAFIRMWG